MATVFVIGMVSFGSALLGGWLRTRLQEVDRLVRLLAPDLGVTGEDVTISHAWPDRALAIACLPPMLSAIVVVDTAGVLASVLFLAGVGLAVLVGSMVGATAGHRSLRAVALKVERTVQAIRARDPRTDLDLLAARLRERVAGQSDTPATFLFGQYLPNEVADILTDVLAADEPPAASDGDKDASGFDPDPLARFLENAAWPLWPSALEHSRVREIEAARAALRGVDWTLPADRERVHALVTRLRQWPSLE